MSKFLEEQSKYAPAVQQWKNGCDETQRNGGAIEVGSKNEKYPKHVQPIDPDDWSKEQDSRHFDGGKRKSHVTRTKSISVERQSKDKNLIFSKNCHQF
jgi:hypothetical protein